LRSNSRSDFLKKSVLAGADLIVLPQIYKRSAFTGVPANNLIRFAQTGCGREGIADYMGTISLTDLYRMIAVCDLDLKRLDIAKNAVETFYKKQGEVNVTVKTYHDFFITW